jgi:hypothetical protein
MPNMAGRHVQVGVAVLAHRLAQLAGSAEREESEDHRSERPVAPQRADEGPRERLERRCGRDRIHAAVGPEQAARPLEDVHVPGLAEPESVARSNASPATRARSSV